MASLLPWVVLMFAVMLSAAQGQWLDQNVCYCSQNRINRINQSKPSIPREATCFEEMTPHCPNRAFKIQGLKNKKQKLCFKPGDSRISAFIKNGGVCHPSVTSV